MRIVKDGNAYAVVADNFENLAESSDVFFIDENEFENLADGFYKIAQFLTDPENQPHQYHGDAEGLTDLILGVLVKESLND